MIIWTMKISCIGGAYLEARCDKTCEVNANLTLDELCDFTLDAFDFDNDHLHQFLISRNPGYNGNPIDDESITLERIFPLEKNLSLFMNFDFGDDWWFKISKMRKKAEFNDSLDYPRVISAKGVNPLQYPMYEDDY